MLVFYPDAPEYRRALLGQIAELSDAWNWEGTREDQALARTAWLAAELETLECHDMACLDEIIAILEAIRDKPCCDDVTGFSEGTETPGGGMIWPIPGPEVYPVPDNDTSPGTGDYPITTVTDPDNDGIVTQSEWEQYLCGAANYIIDSIIDYLRFVRFQRTFTSSFLGVIRWVQARAAGIIIPGFADDFALWELEDIIDTVIGAFEDVFINDIDTAITQLQNIRDSLVCVVVGENTAANAITALLNAISGEIQNALIASLIGSPVTLFASLAWNGLLDTSWNTGCNCDDVFLPNNYRMTALSGPEVWVSPDILTGNWQVRNVSLDAGVLSFEKYNVTGFTYLDRHLLEVYTGGTNPVVGVVFDWQVGTGDVTYNNGATANLTGGSAAILTSNATGLAPTAGQRTLITVQSSDPDYPPQATLDAIAANVHPSPSVNNKVLKTGDRFGLDLDDGNVNDGGFVARSFKIWLLLKD